MGGKNEVDELHYTVNYYGWSRVPRYLPRPRYIVPSPCMCRSTPDLIRPTPDGPGWRDNGRNRGQGRYKYTVQVLAPPTANMVRARATRVPDPFRRLIKAF